MILYLFFPGQFMFNICSRWLEEKYIVWQRPNTHFYLAGDKHTMFVSLA